MCICTVCTALTSCAVHLPVRFIFMPSSTWAWSSLATSKQWRIQIVILFIPHVYVLKLLLYMSKVKMLHTFSLFLTHLIKLVYFYLIQYNNQFKHQYNADYKFLSKSFLTFLYTLNTISSGWNGRSKSSTRTARRLISIFIAYETCRLNRIFYYINLNRISTVQVNAYPLQKKQK